MRTLSKSYRLKSFNAHSLALLLIFLCHTTVQHHWQYPFWSSRSIGNQQSRQDLRCKRGIREETTKEAVESTMRLTGARAMLNHVLGDIERHSGGFAKGVSVVRTVNLQCRVANRKQRQISALCLWGWRMKRREPSKRIPLGHGPGSINLDLVLFFKCPQVDVRASCRLGVTK